MPHSTVRHQFERDVAGWVAELSERLAGKEGYALLMALSKDGQVMTVEVALDAGPVVVERLERLRARAPGFVVFHPFDFPEYASVEWGRVSQATLERLVGKRFDLSDLNPDRSPSGLHAFPETWHVVL